jgi:GNAT superfamily N-acetyltransferase
VDINIFVADYANESHAEAIGFLLDRYASDPMGGGAGLDPYIKNKIAAELARLPQAFSILGYAGRQPVALANCFEGFSTFKCKPLINIHDLVVVEEFRGRGISRRLLAKIEDIAKQKGCCKLTLEVLEDNNSARQAYTRFGFAGYELDPLMGKALFWEKAL